MAGESKVTTDRADIKRWAEDRGGKPAVVKATEGKGQGVGLLRINFPGFSGGSSLTEISWEDFFETFEQKNLAFLYQDKTNDGQTSRFFKFISRNKMTGEEK